MKKWRAARVLNAVTFLLALVVGSAAAARPKAEEDLNIGKVERSDVIQRVTIAGTVVPQRQTLILAPYSGYIQKIYVRIGAKVKQGEPIVSLSPTLQSKEPVFPLLAPFAGTVVQLRKSEGEFIKDTDNKDFILRIDDLGKLFIEANVPEMDLVKLKDGQEAMIKASAILERAYHGIISEIAMAALQKENYGGRSQVEFPVKIEVTDADSQLRPGMSTIVDIVVNKKANVLTLRHEFVHQDDAEHYVILKDGSKRPIKVGLQNEEKFEVIEGVAEGDEIRQVDFMNLDKG